MDKSAMSEIKMPKMLTWPSNLSPSNRKEQKERQFALGKNAVRTELQKIITKPE